LAVSPNTRNAASSESSSDNRWATSLRTIPARVTARAIIRKIAGSATARQSRAAHGACAVCSEASEGCSSTALSTLATR